MVSVLWYLKLSPSNKSPVLCAGLWDGTVEVHHGTQSLGGSDAGKSARRVHYATSRNPKGPCTPKGFIKGSVKGPLRVLMGYHKNLGFRV